MALDRGYVNPETICICLRLDNSPAWIEEFNMYVGPDYWVLPLLRNQKNMGALIDADAFEIKEWIFTLHGVNILRWEVVETVISPTRFAVKCIPA